MAFKTVQAINALGNHIVTDTSAGATRQITSTRASTVYAVYADNSGGGAKAYVKLYNHASPTIGTTDPFAVLMFPAGVARQYSFPEGMTFDTALTYACVTAGGTTGTSGCNIPVTIIASL